MAFIKRARWFLVVAALAAAGVGYGALGPGLHGTSKGEGGAPAGPKEVRVTVAPVTVRPVRRTVDVVGTLEGFEEVQVSAKVDGRVAAIHCEVGDEVRPGQELLTIEDVDYRLAAAEVRRGLELELAKLKLTRLPANGDKLDLGTVPAVARARDYEDHARGLMERARRLSGGRVMTAEEMDRTRTEGRVARSNREQAELDALTTLATARVKQAQLDLAESRVRDARVCAPCPSPRRLPPGVKDPNEVRYVVAARKAAEGEMIRSFPSTTLLRLVIDQPLKLVAAVPERFLGEVKRGQAVALRVEAYPEVDFPGTVERLHPTVDRGNRTFTIEVTVPNTPRKLPAGAFAKASVTTRRSDAAVTVPEEAVVRFAGVVKVFVVEGGQARAVPVRVGDGVAVEGKQRWVEVKGALPAGARVVTSGQSQLADGTPVRGE